MSNRLKHYKFKYITISDTRELAAAIALILLIIISAIWYELQIRKIYNLFSLSSLGIYAKMCYSLRPCNADR